MATITDYAKQGDLVAQAILQEVHRRTEEAIEEEAQKTADAVRRRLREDVGQIATSILSEYSMERQGSLLRIDVKIADRP